MLSNIPLSHLDPARALMSAHDFSSFASVTSSPATSSALHARPDGRVSGPATPLATAALPGPVSRSRVGTLVAVLIALLASGAEPAPTSAQGVASSASVPTPRSVLGFEVGADFHLATYEQSMEYFSALAAASDRVELREVGETSFGRPMVIALISSAENLENLERHREIALRLAHPEGLGDAEARELAREGKAIVWIDGGLHATEVAHAQHTMQLAHDLVTGDDDPEIRAILDDVILLLWPSINPDGQTLVADWYMDNVGTEHEVAPTPFLYQKYVGHDNNRDGYMINMIESRATTRVARDWEPQILYNHHQTAPFPTRIWIPPFAEPVSPRVHPLMWRTVNLVGMAMAQALEERGQKGATHMGTGFDNWYPGFMDHANNFHNVASFLTEIALYRYATPHFYTVGDFPLRTRELRPQSLYSSPWKGGWWRLRDAVDYMLTASFSVLDVAAKYKDDLLYNRYQAGRDVVSAYREGPPYAYFVPREQRDPVAAVELLRRLAYNGIDVHELTGAVTHEGITHPAGTWVIPMDQEFANFVGQLFEVQQYPDLREYPEGPPDQPYDVSGWTLPYQMDVRVVEARSPVEGLDATSRALSAEAVEWSADADASLFDSPPGPGFDTHPVAAAVVPEEGRITGGGGALLLDPAQNNAFKALNRAWEMGGAVRFVPGSAPAAGGDGEGEDEGEGGDVVGGGPPGSSGTWAVTDLGGDEQRRLVRDYAVQARRGDARGPRLDRPRIGLYRPWRASMDEGWTRWVLEMYGFEFESLRNADVRAGELGERYDVIVIADMGAGTIVEGYDEGTAPPRYVGGIGAEGVRELDAFVRGGGTLVTWNGSSSFAVEHLHLPVRDVTDGLEREDFFMSGAILEMLVDPSHPVMSGMPPRSKVMVSRSPVFTTEEGFRGRVLARYATEGSPLLSGYLLGPEHIQGYASAVEVEHGEGRVVLLGMRPQWRGQPFGTFRILFNATLYTSGVAAAAPDNPGFWSAPAADAEDVGAEESEGRGGNGG